MATKGLVATKGSKTFGVIIRGAKSLQHREKEGIIRLEDGIMTMADTRGRKDEEAEAEVQTAVNLVFQTLVLSAIIIEVEMGMGIEIAVAAGVADEKCCLMKY